MRLTVTVEFLGLSRRLAQVSSCLLDLHEQATFRDALREVAARFPALVGPVITPHTFELVPAHMINIDGRRVADDLDAPAQDGQRLIVMFVEAGG